MPKVLVGLYHLLELNQTPLNLAFSPTSHFPTAYHFIAGPGSFTLELCKLSAVVDGDEQLPDAQEHEPNQEDTADHGQKDGGDIGGRSTLWAGPGGTVSTGTTTGAPLLPRPQGIRVKGTCLSLTPPSSLLLSSLALPWQMWAGKQVSSMHIW